jgi:beta-barrel assembly-enhancing protease
MTTAAFFDGETARDHSVNVSMVGNVLIIAGDSTSERSWTISDLHPIDPPAAGQPFRITHAMHPGARLILTDQLFIDQLLSAAPRLSKGYLAGSHFIQVAKWTVGGLAALGAIGYVFFSVLPSLAAPHLPESWRKRTGEQVEKSVIVDAKTCIAPAGVAAFDVMLKRLIKDQPDLANTKITVYDMNLLNAFAVPGGRVIFTKEILRQADTPDEIASVLAHELGHVANFHPEQQLVRVAGLQVLMSAFTGGGSDILSNVAAVATILRYSRDAEREADSYARETLQKAAIDTLAFKRFFEKLLKAEGTSSSNKTPSALDRLGNVLSTHPDTRARIDAIAPLPAEIKPVPSLTDAEWKSLKAICDQVK